MATDALHVGSCSWIMYNPEKTVSQCGQNVSRFIWANIWFIEEVISPVRPFSKEKSFGISFCLANYSECERFCVCFIYDQWLMLIVSSHSERLV